MTIRLAILGAGLMSAVCATTGAWAQPIQGIYVGGGVGGRFAFATKNTALAPGFPGTFDLNQSAGYDARLSLGYALGNGWRFEAEGTFGSSAVKGIGDATWVGGASGRVRNIGIMANALFDMDVGSRWIYPYLGVGFGYQSTRLSGVTVSRTAPAASFSPNGTAGAAAGQVIVGVSLPVPNRPGLSVTVDYRLMDILGGEKFSGAGGTTKLHNQFTQSAILGIRYAFDTPMPAALVQQTTSANSPAQTQTFQVRFDEGSTSVDGHTLGVIRSAAETARQGQKARIEVDGNGDTVVSQALSNRRARAVSAALVQAGVARDAIGVRLASGDTKLGGSDRDEQQNRRVDIVLR